MAQKYLWERRSGRNEDVDPSHRSQTTRDRDRVLYSEAFRRLGGVTQVATGTPDMALHNRLTHSLKVEQVGSGLVTKLNHGRKSAQRLDLGALMAACLAHDIGHPPFGHAGEGALNELVVCKEHRPETGTVRSPAQRKADPCSKCRLEDGFEGNAQTFRILTALAVHRGSESNVVGLDLSRLSLQAVSKYPWARGENADKPRKWGAYDCDTAALDWVQGKFGAERSLLARVMDWADDIAYAVHDIEDFYRIGRVPIDDYASDGANFASFLKYCDEGPIGPIKDTERKAFESFTGFRPTKRFDGTAEDLAALDQLRGTLLTRFINAASLKEGQLVVSNEVRRLNAIVQQLIWYHVIHDPQLGYIQHGQKRVLGEIFDALLPVLEAAYPANLQPKELELRRLPHALRHAVLIVFKQDPEYTHAERLCRALLDYIASLSDPEAYAVHARLRGREAFGHL